MKFFTGLKDKLICPYSFLVLVPVLILVFVCTPTIQAAPDTVDDGSVIQLSLEEAVAICLGQNRNIIRSKNDEESAELNLNSAHSNFDIKLAPAGGIGITDNVGEFNSGISLSKKLYNGMSFSGTPSFGKSGSGYNSRLALSLDIPLLKFSGELVNREIIRSSEFSLRNAALGVIQTQENVFMDTVTGFYTISELKQTVELNRFLVQRFERHSTIAKTKTDIGLADPFDVYRSEIQARDAQVSLSNSMEMLENARDDFKSLLAIPQNQTVKINDTKIQVSKVDLTLSKAEKIAIANSLEIKRAQDNLKEKKRNSLIARQMISPDLRLSFAYARQASAQAFNRDLMDISEDSWGAYLVTSGDFARKIEKNNYFQSRLNIRSAKLDLENIKDQLSKSVRGRLENLNEAWDRIRVIEKKIIDTTGKLKLANVKFNNGLSGNFDMIEAETELHQARLDLLRAKINYIKGTYQLRKTMGTLIEY